MLKTKDLQDENIAHVHLGDPEYFARYRNLHFTGPGFARLWHTIGYAQGAGERGLKLLEHLHHRLTYLNEYGGKIDDSNLPLYRIILGDDGCWGSFTVVWCKAISQDRIHQYAKDNGLDWYKAKDALSVRDELKIWAGIEGYQYYARAFNGGMIWHKGDDVLEGSYGIHT